LTKRQFKVFDTRKATPLEESEIGFVLGETEYVCKPDIQGAVILDFIAAAENGGGGAAAKLLPFFDKVLSPDDLDKFHTQIDSPDEIIEIETLSDIVGHLIEQYTERPTQASSPQDAG
jgi:hypothetical protein